MRHARSLVVVGVLLMLIGALDLLEGAVLILVGAGLAAVGARLAPARGEALLGWAFAMVAAGVAALIGLSVAGGFGGDSGRSAWWGLLLLPYAVGWALGLLRAAMWLINDYVVARRQPAPW
jgi:hypothetical protein